MMDITDLLGHGEYQIEWYRVKMTEFANDGWTTDSPWLRATITNRRLILISEASNGTYPPIVIPLGGIQKIWNVGLGRRDGIMLYLKSGDRIHMFVDWNQGRKFMRDTEEMMAVSNETIPNYLL